MNIMDEEKEIKTVTIYASFVAVADTLKDADKGKFYHAITHYALFNEEPDLVSPLDAFFSLVKPVLDKSNKRKKAGANGGKNSKQTDKQNGSKTEAKRKQNAKQNASEEEVEVEVEVEEEVECYNSAPAWSFPKNAADVVKIAAETGLVMPEDEAEMYLADRQSKGWKPNGHDKAMNSYNQVKFDIRKWCLRSDNDQKEKEAKEKKFEERRKFADGKHLPSVNDYGESDEY